MNRFFIAIWCASLAMVSASCLSGDPAARESAESEVRDSHGAGATPDSASPVATNLGKLVVRVNRDRALGDPKAALAIVEFGDYECPYCRAFHAGTFRELRSAYIDTGKVRYFYKDFPLRSHPQAFAASVVAYCAGAQGQFWEMQDYLFAKQARLGEALYAELVAMFKLDATQFDDCRRSRPAQLAVRRDFEDGRRIQITGTPSFVLGRIEGDRVVVERMATGTPAFETFATELEALVR